MIRSAFLKTADFRGCTWSRCQHVLRTASFRCLSEYSGVENGQYQSSNIVEKVDATRFEDRTVTTEPPCSRIMDRNPEELYRRYLMDPDQPPHPHLLRVAIIGAPNAGKSSFVNKLMGWKVTGVSKKVHTTRANTNTMFNIDNTQIVLVDTPGVINRMQRQRHKCEASMLLDPEKGVQEADVVGVVVDIADKWTRSKLNTEILKVLHLHKDVPSFLILNKVDELRSKSKIKQQNILLDITERLSSGIVNGKPFGRRFTERKKVKSLDPRENSTELFDELEKKYGKLKVRTKPKLLEDADDKPSNDSLEEGRTFDDSGEFFTEKLIELDADYDDMTQIQNTLNNNIVDCRHVVDELNAKKTAGNSIDSLGQPEFVVEKNLKGKSTEICETSGLGLSDSIEQVFSSVNSELDSSKLKDVTKSEGSENCDSITEVSYQSEHLSNILSKPPVDEFAANLKVDMDDDSDWTDKFAVMKEAYEKAKKESGWEHFDKVFMVSSVDGTGIDDVKEYLVSIAPARDWIFHSSIITDQHPYEIAKMCVTQSFLDYVDNYIPYTMRLEVVYWDIDEHNRLNVAMDVLVKSSYEMKLILKEGGYKIKSITASARQALMDAFQCEIRFKLAVKQAKKKTRSDM